MIAVRAYRPADRAAVRRICADTACFGRPIEPVFADRELFADALLGGFTDYEPESCFVAEEEGQVVGYLAGVLDGRRARRVFARRVLPRLVRRVLLRGHWLRPSFWRLMLAAALVARPRSRAVAAGLAGHPATLHLNLDERARGRGAGSALLAAFLDCARARGVRGIHVSVATDGGRRFFAKHGFARLAGHPAPGLAPPGEQPEEVWIMGRGL